MTGALDGPLDGLVVLDLTRFLSGPYATWLLAGMGADVIKIDDPASGDPTASAPPFAGRGGIRFEREHDADLGLAYLKRSRGKRSTTLNLKAPEGRELFLRLVECADVVIQNFRPGVAERLGIDHATLEARNPRIVSCAITGYGSEGPDRDLKSYDLMAQAASGLMAITGEPGGAPVKIGTAFSDMLAGTYAATAVLAAVHERACSGRGQAVEVAMVDCLFAMMMDEPLDCYERLGVALRQGNRIMRFSPFNTYRARDGWVAVGVESAKDWPALARVMGRDDLAHDPRFARVAWRLTNNDEVDRVVGDWVAPLAVEEVVARLRDADLPCAPVRTPQEAAASPQLRERGMVTELRQPDGAATGAIAAGLPLRFARSRAPQDRPAPVPGADTDDVLRRLLGLTAEEVAELARRGAI